MSSGRRPSAISGVSASSEAEVMTIYPSVACIGLARILAVALYEILPIKIFGVKLSYLLFVLPTAPLAILMYAMLKVFGHRYTITNRSVQKWKALGSHKVSQVSLTDITSVEVRVLAGQKFYKAGDLVLIGGKSNDELMTIPGVPYPHIFRQTILEARDARQMTAASLATIKARPVIV
ncbi:MAG: hypothetical protein JWM11_1889 [Planctomycetaceae bacterium]|nr:hypothetical protein [Planctomycetaceae bacterium]